ncbi:dihydroxyacetone kinase subunit DhaL [Paenibacillus montanisoli]|uniref:phosphoenolpyruvate--glycerone phosphotransferase n=1 Tax=Paenibacillus montanisoli TaxID=2081970 RepID=A0A328U6J5_9BACL|nr:dihydroxyacetone kinase subunit DhaL [Paenibacillus montanisoli]RAP76575.1 dihydroxyacetone kinase subunit L [Paenibacillus montanisoli]
METIDVFMLRKMIANAGRHITENQVLLSDLDAAIGDGDHGVSMARGFAAVRDRVLQSESADIGTLLIDTGRMLMKEIGGTCGPLFGTFFLKMAPHGRDRAEISLMDWSAMLTDGLHGVMLLGKADVGDKTMLDALEPAVRVVAESASQSGSFVAAMTGAAEAAVTGAEKTAELVARKGRGRYQGNASLGHQDAGATSVALMMTGFSEALKA